MTSAQTRLAIDSSHVRALASPRKLRRAPMARRYVSCVVVDLSSGRVSALGEAHHVLDLVAVTLLWALAGWPLPRAGRARLRPLTR